LADVQKQQFLLNLKAEEKNPIFVPQAIALTVVEIVVAHF